jgi:hypothetical protein
METTNLKIPNIILFFQGIPVLMLPSLIVQLFAETYLALMHPMFFLVSGVSDAARAVLAIVACIAFIGKMTVSCSMSSLEIIRQALIHTWLLYMVIRLLEAPIYCL